MATVKKGTLTRASEYAQHLRKEGKREFWKGESKALQRETAKQMKELNSTVEDS
mgnify:CR=1 FL=1